MKGQLGEQIGSLIKGVKEQRAFIMLYTVAEDNGVVKKSRTFTKSEIDEFLKLLKKKELTTQDDIDKATDENGIYGNEISKKFTNFCKCANKMTKEQRETSILSLYNM